ncbi:E2 ubiquitin-conjugating enzyme [Malassezia equina]|uniref:E2 ubiquitin-conjugating enzyme n=1 Tax=Malassezia equina TaxID=1381935 RepID=A0AAF0ED24_9BASI|nr:E2 ubiquitin-conjugating enzyme [Malassezia equina]
MSLKSSSSAAKRIMTEMKEMQSDDSSEFTAAPLEENMFEWHFTLRGPVDSPFAEGLYHGKVLLPTDYPFRPPHLVFLTPNGRWKVDSKCQQSNAELLQDRPRPRVDTAAVLPGVPQAATQPGEEQKAPPNPEDTTALPPPETTNAPACFDDPCEKEPANVTLQSTQPPTPAPTLERPLFPEPATSIVISALQRQELSMLDARIESCRRILLLLDSLMGLLCALLVLLLRKNL